MFISFEGIDFSGKSTQITLLTERFQARGERLILVREPGGTPISEEIRNLLLDPTHESMDAVTEFLLFSSSRSQLVREVIAPALKDGVHVIADRFHDSSTVYQGYGRGLDTNAILQVHRLATHHVIPDVTFYVDITVEESYARREAHGREMDRMERSDRDFFERVYAGYQELMNSEAGRFVRIDGQREVTAIADSIWEHVIARLDSTTTKHG